MINFILAIVKYKKEIKEDRKEKKIIAKKEKEQHKKDEELTRALLTIRKHITDTQYILIGKTVSDAGTFKSWTDLEERMTRLRLIKMSDKEECDWIKELDKKFTGD